MGSTDNTARSWGNGWWPELCGQVLSHVEYRFPDCLIPNRTYLVRPEVAASE